ncbi:MAG: glycosyltransferase family 2 protein [Colwellia sp.]|nr:glycosyltransferase family 2 protein [Colwellia sp.]
MTTKISIVIPTKNEQKSIGKLIISLNKLTLDILEIIVINDGSTDCTLEVAQQAGATVITHPYSKGNGAAIKTGARAAKGDILIFMDGDGQHKAEDVPRLIEELEQGFDLVVGARQRGSQASFGRSIANKFYNSFASYMTGHKIQDLTSGFRAVKADKFSEFISLLPNGFSYPTTSTMAFFRAGYSVSYIPIHANKREGKSHLKPIKDGIRFLLIIFKVGTLYSPLKIFVPIAFSIFSLGLGYYFYTFLSYGRFTNMSALMFTTSLIIFMVGLVSEQITNLMYNRIDK